MTFKKKKICLENSLVWERKQQHYSHAALACMFRMINIYKFSTIQKYCWIRARKVMNWIMIGFLSAIWNGFKSDLNELKSVHLHEVGTWHLFALPLLPLTKKVICLQSEPHQSSYWCTQVKQDVHMKIIPWDFPYLPVVEREKKNKLWHKIPSLK